MGWHWKYNLLLFREMWRKAIKIVKLTWVIYYRRGVFKITLRLHDYMYIELFLYI